MTTKTKRKLIRSERPSQDIRDNTKARREWLASRVSEINSQPGLEAKIVGTGSYQSVSVYELTEVEGRLRFRGVCQFCGNSQVVTGNDSEGILVLHGYKRPGDGYIFGRCPGMNLRPLNVEKTHTENWLSEAKADEVRTASLQAEKDEARKVANEALYALADDVRMAGYRARPNFRGNLVRASLAEKNEYTQRKRAWATEFPVHAAAAVAETAYSAARQAHWQAEEAVRHFEYLLNLNVHGTPLTEEVVA